MTLINALKELPEYDVALLNFSSSSSPEMGLETLHQYCEYRRTPAGPVLAPTQPGKWLVVFCDEIDLPAADDYATVCVITFLRQLVERGGFWRAEKLDFVSLERIQFVGACNPPTDPGRVRAHEALRLFQDRLVYDDERQLTEEKIDEVAGANFRGLSLDTALMRPILYSNWLSRDYVPVE